MATGFIGSVKPFDPATDDFEKWNGVFANFLLANDIDETKNPDRCRAIFLANIGITTYTLLCNLVSPDKPETKSCADLSQLLKDHFKPAPKEISERFKFGRRLQQPGESVTVFLAELRKLAVECKFTNLDERLRDQFICGMRSEATQKRLFARPNDIKLADVIALAVSEELAAASTSLVRESVPQPQAEVLVTTPWKKRSQQSSYSTAHQPSKPQSKSGSSCGNCGSSQHTPKQCPHKEVICHNCGKKGHFAKLCRSVRKSTNNSQSKFKNKSKVHETFDVNNVTSPGASIISVPVLVNGTHHTMELDTGARCSILSESFWKSSLGAPPLQKSSVVFQTYTKQAFRPKGELTVKLKYGDQYIQHTFFVSSGISLFGRDLMHKLKLDWSAIKAQCNVVNSSLQPQSNSLSALLKEFSDVFGSTDVRIKNFKAKVILKDDAVPKFLKARQIPFALRSKVDRELDLLEHDGKIERIETSDWASPLVVVPKSNGRVRITGDFKQTVNPQLSVTQYPLARVDDIFATVSGGETFSKMDGADGFYQLELEEQSKKFLVINTHRGLYRYNVLPQGIASSPAIFQECMDRMLQAIPKTASFLDDTVCTGKSDREHLAHLRSVFERMREYNYRLSREKCIFMRPRVEYLGFVLTKEGIHTSPSKVEAIRLMPKPEDVSEVRSFLGLVNFYGKFLPFLSDICAPLYKLTQKSVQFKWTKECEVAFVKVKQTLMSNNTLAHFDQDLPVGIACDASGIGLGIVLFHRMPNGDERPIAFASKILTPTESRYGQIEREALSIVFGVKKFFQYLCGRRFILVTDHKPLFAIFGPHQAVPSYTANRLHRWSLFLSGLDYEINFRKTDEHGNADALSRLPVQDNLEVSAATEIEVNMVSEQVVGQLPVTAKKIRQLSARDSVISKVIDYVNRGWPCKLEKNSVLAPYFAHRDELSLVQGVLMWGIRVVVPFSLQQQILNQLHDSHSGIVRMKSIARQFVWWPKIDEHIENIGKSCQQCAVSRPNPPNAPLHPWEFPEKPWQRLHIDLAGPFLGQMWLVIVDAHSKWPEVFPLHQTATTAAVVSKIRHAITHFGIPDQIVLDNGSQFTSEEFQNFCKSNGIRHSTSSAYHPRSNGEAERFIRTFKKAMKSSDGEANLRLDRFLFSYRITPHATTSVAPCELLQGRKLRSLMDLVKPSVENNVSRSQSRQCKSYDNGTKSRLFEIGQSVWIQTHSKNEPTWSLGTIVSAVGPVSFNVSVNGRNMKRHMDQLLDATVRRRVPPSERAFDDDITPAAVPTSPPRNQPITPQRQPPRPGSTSSSSSPEVIPFSPSGEGSSPSIYQPSSPADSSSSSSSYTTPPQRTLRPRGPDGRAQR